MRYAPPLVEHSLYSRKIKVVVSLRERNPEFGFVFDQVRGGHIGPAPRDGRDLCELLRSEGSCPHGCDQSSSQSSAPHVGQSRLSGGVSGAWQDWQYPGHGFEASPVGVSF